MQGSKLVVYNTLARSKQTFEPLKDSAVNMFVCGQTVYDDAHLGHAKSYINFAVIARWLRRLGYSVNYVQNITDVDDKIIARANEQKTDASVIAEKYEKRFFEDMDSLGIRKDVSSYPRSHDYIDTIREQMQLLIDKRYAYVVGGDVYYDVDRFSDYTKLSGMKIDELKKHRVEPREGKVNAYDFSLWKAAKKGEPSWKIKVRYGGKEVSLVGRPGWHIEDTAMTYAAFGPQYDLHGGASELIFPHHTNEIAQAEAAYGKKPLVKYWLHAGVLNIKGVKMSKSLKNFITIREFLKKYDGEALKLLVCSTHYRKEIEYSEELAKEASKRLRYLHIAFGIFYNMGEEKQTQKDSEVAAELGVLRQGFEEAMNSDFNTPLALTRLTQSINALRRFADSNGAVGKETKKMAVVTVLELAGVLGLLEKDSYKETLPTDVKELIAKREKLRSKKRFDEADEIRKELRERGITVEDTDYGTVWYKEK